MNDACHQIILDLQNPQFLPPLTVKRGDTGRSLHFLLTDHGKPYTITSECSAMFTALNPEGKILYHPCRIEDNTIVYTFIPQTCALAGELLCELKLYGLEEKVLTSPRFTLIVEDTVYSPEDAVEPI